MTETTQTVFAQYQVRKTKKQKRAFLSYAEQIAAQEGYESHIEKGYLGAKNLVIGDPDHAKIIFSAHYDTCPRLPFPNFITPKNILLYLLYQIAIVLGFIFLPITLITGLVCVLLDMTSLTPEIISRICFLLEYFGLFAFLLLVMIGPANKNTANDNTSGVTALLDLMCALPSEERNQVAFVFFDLEEVGLFGSSGFFSKHKKTMKNKPLVNFDCVSDGNYILFALRKDARRFAEVLQKAFPSTDTITSEVASKGVFYPSDQYSFPCGIGVAAFKQSKKRRILYMDRIHTKRDTVYQAENLRYLVEGSIRLTQLL